MKEQTLNKEFPIKRLLRKINKPRHKQRTASERRHQKNSSNPNTAIAQNKENYNSLKYHSKYSSRYKSETKESSSVKSHSSKFYGHSPKIAQSNYLV